MSTCPVLNEISSYMDGECRDPERVARHLQSCPDCARRHMELRKISAHIQAVEAPEVRADFAGRLLARLDEPPRRAFIPLAPAARFAMAASIPVLLGVSLAYVFLQDGTARPGSADSALFVNPAWHNDADVVDALANLMEAGTDLGQFAALEYDLEAEEEWEAVPADDMLELLAASVAEDDIEPAVPEDFAALLDELAALDAPTLEALLVLYESEG